MERMPNYDYNEYENAIGSGICPILLQNQWYHQCRYEQLSFITAEAARIPGYPIIVDQNRDGSITVDDVVMSNEVPDIYFGFGNTFTYKNFDLDIFMYSQLGVHKYNYALDWASATNLANQNSNSNIYAFRLWNSQTNLNGTLPGIAWDVASVTLPGSWYRYSLPECFFLRVRNITLGYNISKVNWVMSGNMFQYPNLFRCTKPIDFTNFEGFDPEDTVAEIIKVGKPNIRR